MSEYAKTQPKHGEMVLHCGHLDGRGHHFFGCAEGNPIKARGPEGTVSVKWLVACDSCTLRAGGDTSKIAWNGLAEWQGDDPVIRNDG